MSLSRDERIEEMYRNCARELAEAVIDLEDENDDLRATLAETVSYLADVAGQRNYLVERVGELEAELEDMDT